MKSRRVLLDRKWLMESLHDINMIVEREAGHDSTTARKTTDRVINLMGHIDRHPYGHPYPVRFSLRGITRWVKWKLEEWVSR